MMRCDARRGQANEHLTSSKRISFLLFSILFFLLTTNCIVNSFLTRFPGVTWLGYIYIGLYVLCYAILTVVIFFLLIYHWKSKTQHGIYFT